MRAPAPAVRREAVREHPRDSDEALLGQIAIARRTREARVQILDPPLTHPDFGDDLLREHVERRAARPDRVELGAPDRVEQRRALDEVVARQREEPALRQPAEPVARAADALEKSRDRARRAELANEVDVADVDAQFERRGRNERLELAGLEPLLRLEPMLLREAAVVRRHRVLAEPLREMARRALGEPARIHEHERRAVLTNQLGEPVVLLCPDLVRHDRLERRGRQLEREVAPADMALVDHRALRALGAREERGQEIDRLRRG